MPIDLDPLPTPTHYSSLTQLDYELGETNANAQADLENNGLQADITPEKEWALTKGDAGTSEELAKASPPASAYPVVSSLDWVNSIIQTAATEISAGELLNLRWQIANPNATATQSRPGDPRIATGRARLQALVAQGLPGVTLDEEDTTPEPGVFTFVPAVHDSACVATDENFRPLWWGGWSV